jgi:hypothetical protein
VASGIAGRVYKNLEEENYFGTGTATPLALLSTESCCRATDKPASEITAAK